MVVLRYLVVWTKLSQQHLRKAYDYITITSDQNAEKVVKEIVLSVNKAIINAEIYPADKYKLNNDGSYRAFEKHRYRISYRFTNKIIRILRVRHTSMEPKEY
ncbi:MAG: type II toxin-antitoxin system RelE/ParE family toxin [Ginsengibacter sp.]